MGRLPCQGTRRAHRAKAVGAGVPLPHVEPHVFHTPAGVPALPAHHPLHWRAQTRDGGPAVGRVIGGVAAQAAGALNGSLLQQVCGLRCPEMMDPLEVPKQAIVRHGVVALAAEQHVQLAPVVKQLREHGGGRAIRSITWLK
jgi:hypothetical protein